MRKNEKRYRRKYIDSYDKKNFMRIQFKFEICVCTDENNDKNKKNLPPVPFFPLQLLTVS